MTVLNLPPLSLSACDHAMVNPVSSVVWTSGPTAAASGRFEACVVYAPRSQRRTGGRDACGTRWSLGSRPSCSNATCWTAITALWPRNFKSTTTSLTSTPSRARRWRSSRMVTSRWPSSTCQWRRLRRLDLDRRDGDRNGGPRKPAREGADRPHRLQKVCGGRREHSLIRFPAVIGPVR